ncbi:MAG: hypothetical protein Q8P08_01605, partial [bacterium]|nr:hypothetical protein [bacterium]
MTPQTAQWYLEIVKAYLEDPQKAASKYQLSPSLLKDVFKNALGTDDLNRVKDILEGILGGKALGQNIPDPALLAYWEEEYERVRLKKIKITDDVIKEIRNNIKYRQMMAQQIHKVMEAERNKPEILEIEEKPEYVQQSFEDLSFELNDRIPSAVRQWTEAKIKPTKEDYTDTILSFALEISKRRELLGLSRERLVAISQNLAEETYQTASEFIDVAPAVKVNEEVVFSAKGESEPIPSPEPPLEKSAGLNLPFGISFGKKPQTESVPVQKTSSATAVAEKPEATEKFTILPQAAPPHLQTLSESATPVQDQPGEKKEAPKKKLSAIDDLRQRIGYQEGEGVIFVPFLSFISPTMTWALFKKASLAPVVKPLQALDILAGKNLEGDGVSEWREMLHHGKTSADLDATLSAIQEEGKINYDDPILRDLEKERARTEAYEQTHPKIHWLLKNYHKYSKLTGNQEVSSTALEANLPKLSPSTWPSGLGDKSTSLQLKRGFDQIGKSMSFVYDKRTNEFGRQKLFFVPQDKIIRFLTLGRVQSWYVVKSWVTNNFIRPMLVGLGKSAFGQGIKKLGAGL